MPTADENYSAALSRRIIDILLRDHDAGSGTRDPIDLPAVLRALAITAARLSGDQFDQSNAIERHTHAQALGALFASTAETIWQHEAGLWPEDGARSH